MSIWRPNYVLSFHEELRSGILIVFLCQFDFELDSMKLHGILFLSKPFHCFPWRIFPLVDIELLGVMEDPVGHLTHHVWLELGALVNANVNESRLEHEDNHCEGVTHKNHYFNGEPLERSSRHFIIFFRVR